MITPLFVRYCTSYLSQDAHATRYMKEEKISRAKYLINCGLLLCLSLGFSLLSIAELLYYVLSILASWVGISSKRNAENIL